MNLTVLDGGTGRELKRIGAPFEQPEWSALALLEAPERVVEAHENFIAAGAEIIIVNSYAVVPFHLGSERFATKGRELVELAGQLARRAADAADPSPLVAASIPPLFGSYEPDKYLPLEAPALYQVIAGAQAPFVDLWIAETMSSIAEATAAIDAIDAHRSEDQPVWLSFCLPDEESTGPVALRSGEPVSDLVDALHDRVDVFSINCSMPERIDDGIPALRSAIERNGSTARIAAYANAFVPKFVARVANAGYSDERDELTPAIYADAADHWIELGASIVGGCCGIHPEHIAELSARHHQ